MSVYAILYASDAVAPPSADDLAALLVQARRHNAARGITGQLVYIGRGAGAPPETTRHAGHFVQWIEGDEAGVRLLYDRIRRDPRHRVQRLAYDGAVRRRLFPSWTMAFRRADYNPGAASLELARLLALAEVPGGLLPPAPTL